MTKPCSLHGIESCVLCYKQHGKCDHGTCQKKATHGVKRVVEGRHVETRPACLPHARRIKEMDGAQSTIESLTA